MRKVLIAVSGKLFLGLNFLVYGKFGLFFTVWALFYASFFIFWELLVLFGGSRVLLILYLLAISTLVIASGFYKPSNESSIDVKRNWHWKIISAIVAIASLVAFQLSNFKIQFLVSSNSMEPTLYRGEPFITGPFKMPFVSKEVKRGDIVIHTKPGDDKTIFVHRVFAVPGDEVAISNGNVFLNGQKQLRPNLKLERNEANIQRLLQIFPNCETGRIPKEYCDIMAAEKSMYEDSVVWSIPEGRYFLLGDNVFNSTDSKHYGPVEKRHLLGRVVCYGLKGSDFTFDDILRAGKPIAGLALDQEVLTIADGASPYNKRISLFLKIRRPQEIPRPTSPNKSQRGSHIHKVGARSPNWLFAWAWPFKLGFGGDYASMANSLQRILRPSSLI